MIEIDDKIGVNNSSSLNNSNISNFNHGNINKFEQQKKLKKPIVIPQKIKLEIKTTVELFADIMFVLPLILTVIVFIYNFQTEIPMINTLSIGLIALCYAAFFLRRNVDEYYVLDSKCQALMLKSKIFSRESYTPFASFRSIHAVVANGRYNSGGKNQPSYWTYRTEIVLNTGKVVPIDDWHREDLPSADRKAKKFSEIANVTYVKGNAECCAKPVKMGCKYTFTVKKRSFAEAVLIPLIVFLIFVLIFGITAGRNSF